jgi:hypothetical protein
MKQNQRIILRDTHIPSAPALAADSIEELLHEDEVDGHNDALRHITTSRHASAGGGATVRYVQEARAPYFDSTVDSDHSVDADSSTRSKYGARAEPCMSSFSGPLPSTLNDGSVGFSTRRDP